MICASEKDAAMKNWREILTQAGGYENEVLSISAGTVRQMVDEIERLRLGYESLHNSSDLEMRDGDMARAIARAMLSE